MPFHSASPDMVTRPSTDFQDVTELAGELVSSEQIIRMHHRYVWASRQADGKDVVEAACGTGPGLGLLVRAAQSVEAGDYSETILARARTHYGPRVRLRGFDAQAMPFDGGSKDVIILFEAIYYVPDAGQFVSECKRVLRPGGRVLIATANKDLTDFNPSPFSHKYFGVVELAELFGRSGFAAEFFGYLPVDAISLKQRILRPVKRTVVALGLMPKTMAGKRLLKRLVFGPQVPMPAEITEDMAVYNPPTALAADQADRRHKVIYCVATLPA